MKEALAWLEYCKTLSPAIIEACTKAPVSGAPGALVKALEQTLPEWPFRHKFCRGGWYRLGGVVKGDGSRVSDNLEAWAEAALEAHDGDLGSFAEACAEEVLYATRLVGRTHYLVAPEGDGVADFLQLEVEELQEMRGHRLFDDENPPGSLAELVDPYGKAEKLLPLGLPFYKFRRIAHVGGMLQRMRAQSPEPAPIHRMLEDWEKSSAGATSAFHNHWVIAMREHLDRYQQTIFRAQPIPALSGTLPQFAAAQGTNQLKLQSALVAFDKELGYPMAWYFHMLATKAVPHWVAQTVVEDALAGFAYLPQRDLDVARNWLHRPYSA